MYLTKGRVQLGIKKAPNSLSLFGAYPLSLFCDKQTGINRSCFFVVALYTYHFANRRLYFTDYQ